MADLRVSKTVNGETTTHILDGANVVADIQGTSISKYNRGRELISMEQNGQKGYYVFNGHGDVVQMRNASGEQVYQNVYDAFGMEIFDYDETNQFVNPFGYAGEYTDEETGNIYLRARYYNPNTGRFLSEDPIKDGTNWYAYAGNNPVLFLDPWGLAAGDPFESIGEAAIDWGNEYGEYTRYTTYEMLSLIYSYTDEQGNVRYSYTKPYFGYGGTVDPHIAYQTLEDSDVMRNNFKIEADIHSHPNNSEFSKSGNGDIPSMESTGQEGFLVGPDGTVKWYYKKEIVTEEIIDGITQYKVSTVWNELTVEGKSEFNSLSEDEQKALYAYLHDEYYVHNKHSKLFPNLKAGESTRGFSTTLTSELRKILEEKITFVHRDENIN